METKPYKIPREIELIKAGLDIDEVEESYVL